MQPLIYKERIQRWGFKQSMFVSLILHGVVIFGVSFVVIQQPWKFNEEVIVNIRFANGEFDMRGSSNNGLDLLQKNNQQVAMVSKDSSSQDQSQLSVRRLESNSTLESYETIYLNAWQRKVETAGYYEISRKDITQGNFKVQIRSIIDSMGNLIGADILKSSGNSSMDALALKILQQSAPFQPFPQDMAVNYQQLEIIRDWNFTNS
ncbi:MAG: TonB family protein [SAR86 cluster bacterium]|uniref:TonB family protein n=1 Tax=SAR86 cluster bacterium TaxID=2030880 RepID=A0A838Y0D6_9GAMM|nr:TonB family protein [SAR86 cluster bacterium]|tara:strand:- start:53 stop:670 length:618 start_codon:yes stop_codon:yes gene_type:complete